MSSIPASSQPYAAVHVHKKLLGPRQILRDSSVVGSKIHKKVRFHKYFLPVMTVQIPARFVIFRFDGQTRLVLRGDLLLPEVEKNKNAL